MSNRLGGFIAGQNISASIGTFTAVTSPTFTFGSTQGTPPVGQAVQFTTTGTLPTGLSLNTTYYVISTSTNTCQFSTTQNGSAVTFTNSSGSGTHTAVTQRAFSAYGGAPDTVEYLVVAGGGGGNYNDGGGGGAGGLLTAASFAVATGSALTVTIGAGGAAVQTSNTAGNSGTNSVFSSITATGGGGGGSGQSGGNQNGLNGGSGGGGGNGGSGGSTGGTGTSGQGFAGGTGSGAVSGYGAGGGGGAGSVGGNGSATLAGNGGAGLVSSIDGTRRFFAGGGGGGLNISTGPVALGGTFNAGNGGTLNALAPTSALANSGSGGGGSCDITGGGNGGSGIVIVRYPQINSAPAMVTGFPQVSYSDGYQIYTWTSSGSIIF